MLLVPLYILFSHFKTFHNKFLCLKETSSLFSNLWFWKTGRKTCRRCEVWQTRVSQICWVNRVSRYNRGTDDSLQLYSFCWSLTSISMLIIQDCFALLVYPKPVESPVGYFLEDSQRELVADAVNAAILSNKKDACHLHSHLEMLLRQLTVCCLERRSMNGDQGETFRLHHVLNNDSTRR